MQFLIKEYFNIFCHLSDTSSFRSSFSKALTSRNHLRNNVEESKITFFRGGGVPSPGTSVSSISKDPHCPAPDGLFPTPGQCTTFISCANGLGCLMLCGPGTYYHSKLMVCVFPDMSDCDPSK